MVVVVVVVVTCVLPKAAPSAPPAPNAVKSTVCPTVAPKSTVWLTLVVVNASFTVAPASITPKLVVPKSTVPKLVVPKSTVPKWVVPKSTVWWVVVPKSRASCLVVPKSTASWTFVPKSIAWWTVVVERSPSASPVATPDPCLIDALRTLFLTISGFTWLFTTSLITEVLTISLCICPLTSCVASVSFLYIVGKTFFSNWSLTFLVSILPTSFEITYLILFWNTGWICLLIFFWLLW